MLNLKEFPAYDDKYYPLYCEFLTAFRSLYPEEELDNITEYFMVLLTNREFETIHLYIVVNEIEKRTGKNNVVILDD